MNQARGSIIIISGKNVVLVTSGVFFIFFCKNNGGPGRPGWGSLSVLFVFVASFSARLGVAVGVVVEVHFVHGFDGLGQIVLQRRQGRAHGRRAEPVRDETEVGQAALNTGLQDGLRARVPQGRAVLGEQVGEFFADLSGRRHNAAACEDWRFWCLAATEKMPRVCKAHSVNLTLIKAEGSAFQKMH